MIKSVQEKLDRKADTTSAEYEALCQRCGISCHFAVPVNGLPVVIDALRCKFLGRSLEGDGRFHCTVYARRFEVAPWCHPAESALQHGFLAQDCPYARGVHGYKGKVRLSPSLLRQVLPAIYEEIVRAGVPSGADPEAVLAFLEQGGGAWEYTFSEDGSRYLFKKQDPQKKESVLPLPRTFKKLPVL